MDTKTPMHVDDIRDDIKARNCEKCDESLDEGVDFVLTFFRGQFIVLHEECARDFIDYATPGPRGVLTGAMKFRGASATLGSL